MVAKREIIQELGQSDLLLPDRIAASLTANDRAKYFFALLQMARANAERPMVPALDLKTERLESRVEDSWLDDVVAAARIGGEADLVVPRGQEILDRLQGAIDEMIACLPEASAKELIERFARLRPAAPQGDRIPLDLVDRITSGDRSAGDSLHLLVMDAHKAINALQAETAVETLFGARVHSLSPRARTLVEAFMRGLNRTAPLKFDHPGLGATATESGGQVLIQNDIGTTDAHVLVIRVAGRRASLTYTDVHAERLAFFQSLFADFDVRWTNVDSRASDRMESRSYLHTTGIHEACGEEELLRYLDHLGSRIVFLIDWNRMRKRLRGFIGKRGAIRVLRYAAVHNFGHRGLLELGGERLLAEAVEYAAGQPLHYGDRLDALIGDEVAEHFIERAFELASRGLLQGRSRRIIADEIKAELRRHFDNSRLAIFDAAARHAACGFDIAAAVREALDRVGRSGAEEELQRSAERAARWESEADLQLNLARDDIRRFRRPQMLLTFLESADDAVDELEEAASLLELFAVVEKLDAELRQRLYALGDLAVASSQELVKCVECAATITSADVRDDIDDFLTALERLVEIEHLADELTRAIRKSMVTGLNEARSLYLADRLAQALESATDYYLHSGEALRAYLMEEVLA
jgi:uncharacterized protein Yka (UPF0111/DUF47 family)